MYLITSDSPLKDRWFRFSVGYDVPIGDSPYWAFAFTHEEMEEVKAAWVYKNEPWRCDDYYHNNCGVECYFTKKSNEELDAEVAERRKLLKWDSEERLRDVTKISQ
jgi:hypothetical protein